MERASARRANGTMCEKKGPRGRNPIADPAKAKQGRGGHQSNLYIAVKLLNLLILSFEIVSLWSFWQKNEIFKIA